MQFTGEFAALGAPEKDDVTLSYGTDAGEETGDKVTSYSAGLPTNVGKYWLKAEVANAKYSKKAVA